MPRYVHKYGGTSVGSIERINAVAARVCRVPQRRSRRGRRRIGDERRNQSARCARPTGCANDRSPREMDVLLATGEQVSIALVAMALEEHGCKARSYLGSQVAIRTDSAHQKARVEHIDTQRLEADLAAGFVPVIAGFQGVDALGDMTTLGRGRLGYVRRRGRRCAACGRVSDLYRCRWCLHR